MDTKKFDSLPVFVVALQRSGTNLFRKSLEATGHFGDLNEVFDPYRNEFWAYRQNKIEADGNLCLPTAHNQVELFECYLKERMDTKNSHTFVDVKYNSTHHMNSMWHDPQSPPAFFDWLAENQFPVVHIVRNGLLDCYVSNEIACAAKNWDSKVDSPSIRLDPGITVAALRRRRSEIEGVRRWLKPCRHLEVTYESLIDGDGDFSRHIANAVLKFVGSETRCIRVKAATEKNGYPVAEVVQNYWQEIEPALLRGGFERLIERPKAA